MSHAFIRRELNVSIETFRIAPVTLICFRFPDYGLVGTGILEVTVLIYAICYSSKLQKDQTFNHAPVKDTTLKGPKSFKNACATVFNANSKPCNIRN